MKTIKLFLFAILLTGCATVTPGELISARKAYQSASSGPAATLVPAELHKAHQALASAEESFKTDPKSYKTRDLSYVAQRKSELAATLGLRAADKAQKEDSDAAYQKKQSAIVEQGKQDLIDAEARGAQALGEAADKAWKDKVEADKLAAQNKVEADKLVAAALADAEADRARQDLMASEKRTAAALAKLAKLAAVKEDERGLVVTLSGNVLFKSNESYLLPAAKTKLDEVGETLRTVSERSLIIEGHTDSMGTASYNQGLSQRRADTVRDYIVRGGFPRARIRAKGMGQGNPIADNSSSEGRANNRRVEIIIEREPHAANR